MIFQCLFFYKIACILNNFKLRQICVFSIKKNMEIKKNIVLLGMMGSGKSTIGGLLAKKLNSVLIDIDKKIEKIQNLKISEIFKTKGEAYFRELEFNVTLQSLDGDNNIISLGGGAFMNKELRKVLKQKSSTFWLHWNADTLIKRIKNNDKRPIIKGLDDAEIKKLINERNKIYYFSDFKICLLYTSPSPRDRYGSRLPSSA